VTLEKIQTGLNEDEELRKVHLGDNTESNKRFMFNKVNEKNIKKKPDRVALEKFI